MELARLATCRAALPNSGALLCVHDRDNEDQPWVDPIQNEIGKALYESPTEVSIHYRIQLWCLLNPGNRDVEVLSKTLPQTSATLLVESERFKCIRLSLIAENDSNHGQPRDILLRTTSQVVPTGPSRSIRARRRSSSSFCSDVSARSSARRLPQRSSISSNFSSGVRAARSRAGFAMNESWLNKRELPRTDSAVGRVRNGTNGVGADRDPELQQRVERNRARRGSRRGGWPHRCVG